MLNLLYATLSGIDQTVFTSDWHVSLYIKVVLGIGNWALEIYCLVLTHVNHCIVPCARMTNYQSNHFLI